MEAIKNIFYGVCSLAIMLLYLAVCCMMAAFPVLVASGCGGRFCD